MIPKSMRPLSYVRALPLGIGGRRAVRCSEQRGMGRSAESDWQRGPEFGRRRHSSHKLFIFALQVLALAAVRAIFLFLTRWIVIGISGTLNSISATILFAQWKRCPTPITSGSYRRPDGAHDQRPECRCMLIGPSDYVLGENNCVHCRRLSFMVQASPRLPVRFCLCPS